MTSGELRLAPGDVIEIKYRNGRAVDGELRDRWYRAWVIDASRATWPLVRLADGQITELRPFMPWRMIEPASQTDQAAA